MESHEIMVSVGLIAYNHEQYIRKAIDGVLSQKTSFAVQIIIHDDASTDGTQEIIKEYERNYPDIIETVCQTENKYNAEFID